MQKQLLALAALAAQAYAERWFSACTGNTCSECPDVFDFDVGFPVCHIYDVGLFEDRGYTQQGAGFEVYWDIPDQGPDCRAIVRSPAAVDAPGCGTSILSARNAGCYQTFLSQSFMVQFCCGSGDCDAAESVSSIGEARTNGMRGVTSSVSLKPAEDEGTFDLGDAGKVSWKKRAASPATQAGHVVREAKQEATKSRGLDLINEARGLKKRCNSFSETRRETRPGSTVELTPVVSCNTSGGCTQEVGGSVSEGRTISASVGVNFFEVISAELSVEFTETRERSFATTYTIPEGGRGRIIFTSTYQCYIGTVGGCDGDGAQDGEEIEACEPREVSGTGEADGTFFFRTV